jgi:hypothetical protein
MPVPPNTPTLLLKQCGQGQYLGLVFIRIANKNISHNLKLEGLTNMFNLSTNENLKASTITGLVTHRVYSKITIPISKWYRRSGEVECK